MTSADRAYTIAEAAVLGDMPVKTVNNAIDKHVVGEGGLRALSGDELVLLKIWHGVGSSLASETRRRLFAAIKATPQAAKVRADDLLIIDVAAARRQVQGRMKDLDDAEALVVSDAAILGGEPVIKGTRIPARLVRAMLDDGASEADILEGYPTLTARDLMLTRMWTSAHPARGRPRTLAAQGERVASIARVPLVPDPGRTLPTP